MDQTYGELCAPTRLMMTPGPSSVDPRIYKALATPLVGHMDPWFVGTVITETQDMLRRLFQTQNRVTFPLSASGSGGMEASVINPLEVGDEAVIAVNGTFSERMALIAERTGAKVHRVGAPLGRPVDPDDIRRFAKGRKMKLVGLCHGETSTGVLSSLEGFRQVADELGALLVVDSVATLAGSPVDVDRQQIDICFSSSQKAISATPGTCPFTVGPRTEEVLRNRKTPVQSWYFDLTTVMNFWGQERIYHHTPPISIVYALREALRIIFEEGLENRWRRHRQNQAGLIAGLEAMGFELFVKNPVNRLPTVTSVVLPPDFDDARVRGQLLEEFGIEVAGGIGSLKGKIWRVGLMGYVSQEKNVLLFLAALEKVLLKDGYPVSSGAGVGAAIRSYAQPEVPALTPQS